MKFKHIVLLTAAAALSLNLADCSCSTKKKEEKPVEKTETVDMPGGSEPDVAAPPVDVTASQETEILQQVNADNSLGAHNVLQNVRQINSEYNLDTHTIIRVMQITVPASDSRKARLEMKSKFLKMLRDNPADVDRLQRGVNYRYEFITRDGNGLYTFNITKNDLNSDL